MSTQEYGPLRSRASRKPWPECPELRLYQCDQCGGLLQGLHNQTQSPACCDVPMRLLQPQAVDRDSPEFVVNYRIVGGLNQNAVEVSWEGLPAARPEWILLKTFSGSYIKHIPAHKRPPVVFPLSDEDAYVYCDRNVCKSCVFRCKLGFVIYAYNAMGLFEIPLDRMAAYFTDA